MTPNSNAGSGAGVADDDPTAAASTPRPTERSPAQPLVAAKPPEAEPTGRHEIALTVNGSPVTAKPPEAEPTGRHEIALTVNGSPVTAEVESRLLLTDFLRHRLRLTGTHVGCEQGACGACTILVDGRAVRSCLMLAAQADGRDIRTIEGLADPGDQLSPVQQAFADQHGLQCGFCTPGFVISLTVLSQRAGQGAHVDEAELDQYLDSSFCRCTGYVNIRRAARQALGLDPDAGPSVAGGTDDVH